MNIEVGMRFAKVKTGEVVEVIEFNKKFGTVVVRTENGKNVPYSGSTIKDKRNWTAIESDEAYVKEVMDQKAELGIECPTIDHYDVVDETDANLELLAGGDSTEQAEIKVEHAKTKKAKKEPTSGEGLEIVDFIMETAKEMGYDICPSNCRFVSFKRGGKMKAGLFSYSKKSATLGFKGSNVEATGIQPTSLMKHSMDFRYKFEKMGDDTRETIKALLKASL